MKSIKKSIIVMICAVSMIFLMGCPTPNSADTDTDTNYDKELEVSIGALGMSLGASLANAGATASRLEEDSEFVALIDATPDDGISIVGDYSYSLADSKLTFTNIKIVFSEYNDSENKYEVNGTIWLNSGVFTMSETGVSLTFNIIGPLSIKSEGNEINMKFALSYSIIGSGDGDMSDMTINIDGEYVVNDVSYTIDFEG